VFLLDADRIDRATVDEGEEPGTRVSPSRIEAGRRSPDVEECLLNGILRESAVPENSNRHPVSQARVLAIELVEGANVALSDTAQQVLIATGAALNGPHTVERHQPYALLHRSFPGAWMRYVFRRPWRAY
jgi:hypothetical protein